MSKKGMKKFLVGAGIGAAITALFTTEKGKIYQAKIANLCEDMLEKVKNIDTKEVKDNFTAKVNEIKDELKDLDKEKALDLAKEKAAKLVEKSKDLAIYAKEKGTPVNKKAGVKLKEETIKATKKILAKLEKDNKETKKTK